jgi:CarD family transcriptional regulator
MNFQIGDWVMHCTHGLGQVVAIEQRTMNDNQVLYYTVKVADLTIWVPVDENIKHRLRLPTSPAGFRQLLSILSEPAVSLPTDTRQRNLQLHDLLKDGEAESRCMAIRDLAAYRHNRSWSEHDRELMKHIQKTLIGEWSFSLSITPDEAEQALHRSLANKMD